MLATCLDGLVVPLTTPSLNWPRQESGAGGLGAGARAPLGLRRRVCRHGFCRLKAPSPCQAVDNHPPPSSPTVSVSRGRRRKRSLPFSYSFFFFWRDGHRRDCRSKHSKNEVPRSAKHASAEGHVRGDGDDDDDDALARCGRRLCRPRRQQRLTAAAFRLRLLPGCPQERLHEHPQVRGARVVPGAADVPCRRPTWRGRRPVLHARHHGRAGRQAVQGYAVHIHYGSHHVRCATPRPTELLHGERGRGSRQRGELKCAGPRGPRLLPVSRARLLQGEGFHDQGVHVAAVCQQE